MGAPLYEGVRTLASKAEHDCSLQASTASETYQQHLRQVMAAASWPWPEHVMLQREKQPRFVHSVKDFLHELQYGCHLDEIVVFPGGVQAIGQNTAMHPDIRDALRLGDDDQARNAYDVIERMSATGVLHEFKGKVNYRKALSDRKDTPAGGSGNSVLAKKWEDLHLKCPEDMRSTVYLAEIRRLKAQLMESGLRHKRKSTMTTTMRERAHLLGMDVKTMLFWDDFSEGVFIGGGNSSYGLHVDCIPTSNVGTVFAGHKLLALWRYGDSTKTVMKDHFRSHFASPLDPSQVQALESACAVVLAPPGSLYIFSGAQAHAVCNVGLSSPILRNSAESAPPLPSLVVSSYEAFVGMHQRHADVMAMGIKKVEDDSESDTDLEEFHDEVLDNVKVIARRLQKGSLADNDPARSTLSILATFNPRIQEAMSHSEDASNGESDEDTCKSKRRRQYQDGISGSTDSGSAKSTTSSAPCGTN